MRFWAWWLIVLHLCVGAMVGQTVAPTAISFPHLIRYTGTVAPSEAEVRVSFRLFETPSGGSALWQETQSVRVQDGRLNALIGAATKGGIPELWFSGNTARWLEVQVEGEAAMPRTQLVSVPYAMKAASADLFGGRPLSDFVLRESGNAEASLLLPSAVAYATLGANAFVGNQTVTGSITATGAINASNSVISSNSIVNQLLWVQSTATSGAIASIRGANSSVSGTAVYGTALAATGNTYGVQGRSNSPTGIGVFGFTSAATGTAEAIVGQSAASTGHGVAGYTTNLAGVTIGVYGQSVSSHGTGVMGESKPAANGYATYGVVGKAHGNAAVAVQGIADSVTGATIGVQGSVASASGTGGYFSNSLLGNILIGQAGPNRVFRVDGAGTVYADGGLQSAGADFAESIAVRGERKSYEPGDLLVIDEATDRQVKLSNEPYSTRVIGIYSTKPGTLSSTHRMDAAEFAREIPVAVIGIVPCKATSANGAIHRGDLLVSSSLPGYAMKATDRTLTPGAIVGKAMQELTAGEGVIEVLVTLE